MGLIERWINSYNLINPSKINGVFLEAIPTLQVPHRTPCPLTTAICFSHQEGTPNKRTRQTLSQDVILAPHIFHGATQPIMRRPEMLDAKKSVDVLR